MEEVLEIGKKYDFKSETSSKQQYEDYGLIKCPSVCANTARTTAETVLNNWNYNSNVIIKIYKNEVKSKNYG